MENKEEILIELIKNKVTEMWDNRKEPYLLSSIGTDFKDKNILKDALNKKRLKEWIIDNEEKMGIQLKTHPTQSEKIGLLPRGASYEYKIKEKKEIKKIINSDNNNREITLSFISILKDLPEDELNKIIIPTSTLVKLLGE